MRALTAVTASAATLVALPALAQPFEHGYYGHMHYGFGFGNLLFWALLIFGIVWLVRRRRMPYFNVPFGTQGAMNTLRERFAKGEISAEEFDERRKKLSE